MDVQPESLPSTLRQLATFRRNEVKGSRASPPPCSAWVSTYDVQAERSRGLMGEPSTLFRVGVHLRRSGGTKSRAVRPRRKLPLSPRLSPAHGAGEAKPGFAVGFAGACGCAHGRALHLVPRGRPLTTFRRNEVDGSLASPPPRSAWASTYDVQAERSRWPYVLGETFRFLRGFRPRTAQARQSPASPWALLAPAGALAGEPPTLFRVGVHLRRWGGRKSMAHGLLPGSQTADSR
jgi:hypothetical protein